MPNWQRQAHESIERFVEDGTLPAVALATGTSNDVHVTFAGTLAVNEPVTRTTRFDVASLTKVMATLPLILRLVDEGHFDLDTEIKTLIPNAGWLHEPSLGERTVRELLLHTSGLPATLPFIAVASNRRQVLGQAMASALTAPPGTVQYSDLGFILLGAIAESQTGRRLDALFEHHVTRALDMPNTRFVPIEEAGVPHHPGTAPTEVCAWRGGLMQGQVHDEGAWLMGGVAGHAGLFTTIDDAARYAQAWLTHDARLASSDVIDAAVRRGTPPGQPARGLGWVLARDDDEPPTKGVDWRGPSGFGHTGFTGTSLWIDPVSDRFCVLLSNRVYPNRHRVGTMSSIRRALHATVFSGEG